MAYPPRQLPGEEYYGDSRYDYSGRNRRGQRKVGYKKRTESAANNYAGVNANYALQQGAPGFGNPGGAVNAQEIGGTMRQRGMQIGPGGSVLPTRGPGGPPLEPASFRQALQRRQRGGGGRGDRERGASAAPSFGGGLFGTAMRGLFGGVSAPGPGRQPGGGDFNQQNPNQQSSPEQNRAYLQSLVEGKKLLKSVQNPSPIYTSSPEAVAAGQPQKVLRSKYGSGSYSELDDKQQIQRPPGMIGGQTAQEFFRDNADRTGRDNKFATAGGTMDPKKWREALARKNLDKPGSRRI